ncbi:MAG: serine hydrolase, partial [Pseudomonadota bacterium]
ASGWSAIDPRHAMGMRRYLATLPPEGAHGRVLRYCSPNSDLLGWVLERATGQAYADLLSDLLWSRIGAEEDAYIAVDGYGSARASGGLCTTTRDLARLGQMVLDLGQVDGEEVVPAAWIGDILKGGDPSIWRGGSYDGDLPDTHYRSLWYTHGDDVHAIAGMGIYGQALYVHPASRTVIAKHSSQPAPLDYGLVRMQRAAFEAIAQGLA